MVFGKPKEGYEEFLNEKEKGPDGRLLDFNLLYGCRGELPLREANKIYKRNFRQISHNIRRAGGWVTDTICSRSKDFRGFPEDKLREARWNLEDYSVVIKVHGKQGRIYKAAAQACYNLRMTGCPYVTLLLADGEEDVVEIHDDTSTFDVISGATKVENQQALTQYIETVVREKYDGHKLNGAAPYKLSLIPLSDAHKPSSERQVS